MFAFTLNKLGLNDGSEITPGPLTVICGPNNVGKSRSLKDIRDLCASRQQVRGKIILRIITSVPQSLAELRQSYDVEMYLEENRSWVFRSLEPELCSEYSVSGGSEWPKDYEIAFLRGQINAQTHFLSTYGTAMFAFLTTEHRLQLVKESDSPSHENESSSILQALYDCEKETEQIIRRCVKNAFGCEVALDFSVLNKLRLRVGPDFSQIPADPRDAKPIFAKYPTLDDQGDGIRSFVGIVVALLAVHRSLFLIDEPEAFLHPPQAFRIGEFLAEQASNARQIILATHSADVLRGIISKTRNVTIIRMDREGEKNAFKQLEPGRLKNVICDPLLSSARVLDGLFYSGAVVVEADSDARFYHTASHKHSPNLDLHFVNADNKQTVPRIVRLYHDMGVHAVGVVDFDILRSGGDFKKSLEELGASEEDLRTTGEIRDAIGEIAKDASTEDRFNKVKEGVNAFAEKIRSAEIGFSSLGIERSEQQEQFLRQVENRIREIGESSKGWRKLKEEGRDALPLELQPRFDELWKICAKYGLLIVPTGQLESMLTEYGIERTTDKRSWLGKALTLVAGLTIDDSKYPWRFVKEIHSRLGQDWIS